MLGERKLGERCGYDSWRQYEFPQPLLCWICALLPKDTGFHVSVASPPWCRAAEMALGDLCCYLALVAEARATSSSPSMAVCLGVPPAAWSVAVPPLCLQPARCGAARCWGSPCVHGSNRREVAQGWQGAGISRCFVFTSQTVVNVECFCRFDSLGEEVSNA